MTINRFQLEQWADETDQRHGFDPGQMRRLIRQESGWNPAAVSPVGARGLTQFMPDTAQEWGVDLNDPRSQIEKGGDYLAHLRDRYGGNMRKAIAAYNWGMDNVEKHGLKNMPQETRTYLQNVYAGPGMPQTTQQPPPQPPPQPTQPVSAQPAPSVDDMLMTELMRTPERRQTNLYDIMGMAGLIMATAGGNPQMATATTAIMQMIQGREQAERDAEESRQDRMMQMIALRRGTPTGTQTRDIQEYRLAQEQGYQGRFDDWIRQSTAWRKQRPAPTGTTGADFRVIGGRPYFVNEADQTLTPAEGFESEQETPSRLSSRAPTTTEGERKSAGFYHRMNEAEKEIDTLGNATTADIIASRFGDLGNYFMSDEGQTILQQQVDWARAKLRHESGAVIGIEEAREEAENLFPRPGDSDAVIEAKKRSRQRALMQMRVGAGRAIHFVDQPSESLPPDIHQAPGGQPVDMNALPYQPSPAPAPALPSGVDADLDAQIMSYGG